MKQSDKIAWAAGLFEGEGCVYLHRPTNRSYGYARMSMTSTDLDVLQRFARVVGVGSITYAGQRNARRKESWAWNLHKKPDVERLYKAFRPYLGSRRRAKFKEVLAQDKRIEGQRKLATHCKRGHKLSGRNLRVWGGRRYCYTCWLRRKHETRTRTLTREVLA